MVLDVLDDKIVLDFFVYFLSAFGCFYVLLSTFLDLLDIGFDCGFDPRRRVLEETCNGFSEIILPSFRGSRPGSGTQVWDFFGTGSPAAVVRPPVFFSVAGGF